MSKSGKKWEMRDLYNIEENINYLSEKKQIELVRANWTILEYIWSPSEVVIRAALEINGRALYRVRVEVSEELENIAARNMIISDFKWDWPNFRYESSREIYRKMNNVYGVIR